jgi:lipoprotein NlpI
VGRYEKALSIRADYAQVFSNCGLALHNMRRFDAALHHY